MRMLKLSLRVSITLTKVIGYDSLTSAIYSLILTFPFRLVAGVLLRLKAGGAVSCPSSDSSLVFLVSSFSFLAEAEGGFCRTLGASGYSPSNMYVLVTGS